MENRSRNQIQSKSSKGISLLELLVTVTIVAILASIAVAISGKFIERAKKVKCISRMRGLHSGFVAYIQEHGHWPQIPEGELTEDEFFRIFFVAMEPYGVSEEYWLCPSDEDMLKYTDIEEDKFYGSYIPTPFDDKSATPFRWNQPWVIERGDFHGGGGHMLMPDGSIQQQVNMFSGRR